MLSGQRTVLMGLFGVSVLWGFNYVASAYLLQFFSPIFLSTARIGITSLFLLSVAFAKGRGVLRKPTFKEWGLLLGVGVFGTLFNQVFYFTGLNHSTPANAALIIAMSPVATVLLERLVFGVRLTISKGIGVLLGLMGVIIIVAFGSGQVGMSAGDIYLLLAMLALSVSLLFIRGLSGTMSSYAVTIFATVLGACFMLPAAGGEWLMGGTRVSSDWAPWLIMAAAGVVAQGLAGFWWNRGVGSAGAGTAAMFMNLPPFVALLAGHFFLGDAIYVMQVVGGMFVLLGVLVANSSSWKSTKTKGPEGPPGLDALSPEM